MRKTAVLESRDHRRESLEIEPDRQRKTVTLHRMEFENDLVASFLTEDLPSVYGIRVDDSLFEHLPTLPRYDVVIALAGRPHPARLSHLSDGRLAIRLIAPESRQAVQGLFWRRQMKLLVLSDLHLETGATIELSPTLEYDTAVLAGDIHSPGREAVRWAQRDSSFGGRPVILVPGNHEFYRSEMRSELDEMRKVAAGSNVHLLDRGAVAVGGVRFLGCTLWTDFQLPIRQPTALMESDVSRALETANRCLNDFRLIETSPKIQFRAGESRRLLRAEDTLALHWVDRDWLRRELAEPSEGPTVVVTHHAPSSGSIAERYAADWLTPAFVSELPGEFFERAVLWVHGHTHSRFDYRRIQCRIVSNPRGYRLGGSTFENRHFDPGSIIDVSDKCAPCTPDPVDVRTQAALVGYQRTDASCSSDELLAELRAMTEARRRNLLAALK